MNWDSGLVHRRHPQHHHHFEMGNGGAPPQPTNPRRGKTATLGQKVPSLNHPRTRYSQPLPLRRSAKRIDEPGSHSSPPPTALSRKSKYNTKPYPNTRLVHFEGQKGILVFSRFYK